MSDIKHERLNPLNDYIFQKLLGEKGDEEQLLSFLNAVLKRTGRDKLVSVEIIESKVLTAEIIGDKTSILDIRAVTDSNTKINIEVQLRNLGNMDRRSLFYWSRDYSKGIDAGQDYTELPDVIAINIVNFDFIPLDDFHTTFHLWEDNHRYMLTGALEIHFIDITKFRQFTDKDIVNNPLHRWLIYFDKNTPNDILEEVIEMDRAIKKANEKMEYISSDKETLRIYQMREMALSDYTSGINHAKRETAAEIAREMLLDGETMSKIMKYTKLTEKAINDIQLTFIEK